MKFLMFPHIRNGALNIAVYEKISDFIAHCFCPFQQHHFVVIFNIQGNSALQSEATVKHCANTRCEVKCATIACRHFACCKAHLFQKSSVDKRGFFDGGRYRTATRRARCIVRLCQSVIATLDFLEAHVSDHRFSSCVHEKDIFACLIYGFEPMKIRCTHEFGSAKMRYKLQ